MKINSKNSSLSPSKDRASKNKSNIKCIACQYSAYQWVANENRQVCWVHLERDFRKISERAGSSSVIGTDLLLKTNHLFHFWHQFKEGKIDRKILKKKTKSIRVFIGLAVAA